MEIHLRKNTGNASPQISRPCSIVETDGCRQEITPDRGLLVPDIGMRGGRCPPKVFPDGGVPGMVF